MYEAPQVAESWWCLSVHLFFALLSVFTFACELKLSLSIMSMEISENKTDQETNPLVADEEMDDLNLNLEDDGEEEDADQEMNREDEAELDLFTEDGLEKQKKKCLPDHCVKRKKKKAGSKSSGFTEGWVEFRDKRIAKRVAFSLHNTPMANRKRSPFSSDLWCIKYLHRFQWCHLSERLAYEQTVYHQRMRTEISQAKKETNFYLASVEKSQNIQKLKKKNEKKGEVVEEKSWNFKQRPTEMEIQMKRIKDKGMSEKDLHKAQEKSKAIQEKSQSNVSLLAKIFNRGRAQD
ncbi:Activator of basal transcription 1 [Triplophysa tibetana]|uniref:Activator of basal transcription 1 n=1 Tax=Triplophysa tibetana TaxID=1572043 RepID=A0A5A9NX43_9TELE|nr:Activator of basal transcription 1 [Triplophysa tibetana]